jgi:hypothetical protein
VFLRTASRHAKKACAGHFCRSQDAIIEALPGYTVRGPRSLSVRRIFRKKRPSDGNPVNRFGRHANAMVRFGLEMAREVVNKDGPSLGEDDREISTVAELG